jgi:hypothetical protein
VDRRHDRTDAEAELKPHAEIDQQADERQHRRVDALAREFLTDDRSDDLGADHLEVADPALRQRGLDLILRVAQRRPRLRADVRHANHHLMLLRIAVSLDDGIAARKRPVERPPHLLNAHGLIELRDHHRAAGELDALGDPFGRNGRDPGKDDDPRDRDGVPSPAEEVVGRAFENMHG